ncbi:DUF6445 family protein [Pseudoxanthomonas sp. CF125]|uniref:DUF6445 family protein n=1 Tax=Pseudoxanthomonas sp. CF125 TaxID=1855303 RepID=UPI00088B4CB7|nr:DUF6445 family protein [Pseudoxanthomonas sp. CF125]SDQ42043.1 hypothetical protein SAMN05216569_1058 [Pseudoxanthomonas sp. CF125]
MRIFDHFLADPLTVREEGLAAPYIDWEGHDGQVYKRVCLTAVPGLQECIEAEIGPVDMLGMGYRLNFAGELPNAAIHSDLGWGTHALVLYLCDGVGGTAFWRHKATGATRIDPGDFDLWQAVKGDWDNEDAWDQIGLCEMQFNRAVIYEGANFHSRYPFAAFGTGPEDGRLIAVAFFTPRK